MNTDSETGCLKSNAHPPSPGGMARQRLEAAWGRSGCNARGAEGGGQKSGRVITERWAISSVCVSHEARLTAPGAGAVPLWFEQGMT